MKQIDRLEEIDTSARIVGDFNIYFQKWILKPYKRSVRKWET